MTLPWVSVPQVDLARDQSIIDVSLIPFFKNQSSVGTALTKLIFVASGHLQATIQSEQEIISMNNYWLRFVREAVGETCELKSGGVKTHPATLLKCDRDATFVNTENLSCVDDV